MLGAGVICCLCFIFLISCTQPSDPGETPLSTLKETIKPSLSPVITATPTPAPLSQVLPTYTLLPLKTLIEPILTNTDTVSNMSGKSAVAIQLWDGVDGGTVDILDDNFKLLTSFPSNYIAISSFSSDGCHLNGINYIDGGFKISELDLQGHERKQRTVLLSDIEDGERIYQYTLSPSEVWLAYKRVDQIQLSVQDAGFQNVRLLKVNETSPQEVIELTKRGGARPTDLAWSPDSRFLAYTDYDEMGVQQIYFFSPEERQEHQITRFNLDMKDHVIEDFRWSPDLQVLAFLIVGPRSTEFGNEIAVQDAIGIISIPGFGLEWVELMEYSDYQLYGYNWGKLQTIVWDNQGKTLLIPLESNTGGMYLAWYDLESGKVVHLLKFSQPFGQSGFFFCLPLRRFG